MRRSDYQRHLYEAAIEAGCTLRLGTRVTTIDVDLPSVTLESGEVINTDLIVVADGTQSLAFLDSADHIRRQIKAARISYS